MKKKKVKVSIKIKFYNCLLGFFSLSLIILGFLVISREIKSYTTYKNAQNVLKSFESLISYEGDEVSYKEDEVKIGKYRVIGSINIPSVALIFPILDTTSPEALNLSITKLYGPGLNEKGNVSLAGHNSRNGNFFGRLSGVVIDDIIEITDLSNRVVQYRVYDIYIVGPNNLEPTKTTNDDIREITLITCIQSGKKRLIVKAIEV